MLLRSGFAILIGMLLSGCVPLQRNPVPIERMAEAEIAGMPGIRAWGDESSAEFQADIVESLLVERDEEGAAGGDAVRSYDALLISGGGESGAFGAGFLRGWSESGRRPVFKLVTGISAGALIAPFAFLGSEYDDVLESTFTTIGKEDIYKSRNPFSVLGNESLVKSEPLAELITRLVDADLLRSVAREHEHGRRLYVATANLDAQRLVVWNMGRIALYDDGRALELFRKVMLASSSIPLAFPPVYFDVVVDGARYDEMHVDGGVLAQFFFVGAAIDLLQRREALGWLSGGREGTVYVIRNDEVGPAPEQVPREMLKIAERSLDTMIKATAMGDLFRVYTVTRLGEIDFRYIGIPEDFHKQSKKVFATEDMRRLFDIGRSMALEDDPWRGSLPTFDVPDADLKDGAGVGE